MKRETREFLEQEEATRAARSKDRKAKNRRRVKMSLHQWIVEKAERIEASGNRAGAEQYRSFWRQFPEYRKLFPRWP